MIKLRCLGSRPFGRHPIFVEEIRTLVRPSEEIDGRDATWSNIICDKYPGCFSIVEYADPEMEDQKTQKMKKQGKDKMLSTPLVDKEFV